jgi:hypothetical protein
MISMQRGRVIGAILLLVSGLLLVGCKQSEGDRCQLDSDCGDNLRCCIQNTTAARAVGGVCTLHLVDTAGNVIQDKCELPTVGDSGPRLEARVRETGVKEAGAQEARTPDRAVDKAATTPDKPPATPDAKTGQ